MLTLVIVVLGLYTYFLVVLVGAGSPLDFPELCLQPGQELNDFQPPEYLQTRTVTVKHNGDFRFCNKCKAWKPDRCHHCSSCNQCILRMDHHCPWFATCIGFKNHRYFIQFLSYTLIYGAMATILGSVVFYRFFTNEEYLDTYFSLTYLFLWILGLTIFLSISIFDGFSIYQVMKNVTTIESYDMQRYRSNLNKNRDPYYKYSNRPNSDSLGNVFNLGWRENWKSVMGSNWKEWCFPIKLRTDVENLSYQNGLNYAVNEEIYAKLQENARIQNELYDQLANYRQSKKDIQQALLLQEEQASGTRYGQMM